MEKEIDMVKCIQEGDFSPINQWNKDNIWSKIGIYDTETVVRQITGGPLNADNYVNYLKSKFSQLYNL